MRTFLTILGVGVGIGAVLFLVSLGYGLQNVILSRITSTDSLLSLDVAAGGSDLLNLTKENIDKISAIDQVKETSPVAAFPGQMNAEDLTGDSTIYSVGYAYFRLSGVVPIAGRVFSANGRNEVVISSAAAKLFNWTPDQALGKQVFLTLFVNQSEEMQGEEMEVEREVKKEENPYYVKGVMDDDNASYVYVNNESLGDIPVLKYESLKARVGEEKYMGPVRDKILEMGFTVSSLSDTIDQANKIFKVVQIILALFGLIALLVSAIGMFNTMTITLLERINEIGIMRAIGVKRMDIVKLFLLEAVIMGFLGGVGGVVIGYVAGELANFGLNLLARNFGGQPIDIFFRPMWFVILIVCFSTIIGFITGLYPSRRAAKINPLEALRYK